MADDDWKALMYGEDTDDDEQAILPKSEALPDRGIVNMPAMSAELRRLRTTLDTQERTIKRLLQRIRNVERRVIAQTTDMRGLSNELDSKIDRRD